LSFEEYLSTYINTHEHLPTSTISVKQKLNEIFSESFDYSERDFKLLNGRSIYISYFSALISQPQLEKSVIQPLLEYEDHIQSAEQLGSILTVTKYEVVKDWKMAIDSILD
ncbi:spore germination protein, partial [Pseudomonas sp. 2822-17]|uniref:spore germination protein n=1 Tax=Pseudomonas sp. 2822-17 TaxID=1712678 RepID=UPI00117A776D